MTIASTVNRRSYQGSGTTGPFAYDFRVFAVSDLRVVTRDPNGLETTLAYPGEFTATGIGARTGGVITLTTPLATGWALSIRRVRPLLQDTELRNQGPYFPEVVEDAFDKGVMLVQQLEDEIARAPRLPESIDPSAFDTTLPANLTPGNALVVNGAGNGFSMATLDDATLSAWNAANNIVRDVFTTAHGDFTPGTTTSLTLSQAPGSAVNLTVMRRTSGANVAYLSDEYSLAGNVITFTAAIPANTTRVEVVYLHTYQVNTADAANVTYAPLTGAGTDVRTRLRAFDNRLASLGISITDAPYNADPTGTFDSSAAFNAAAAAVDAAGGGDLIVPRGTYLIDNADLVVSRKVNVRGAGALGSVLRSRTGKRLKVKGADLNWDQVTSHLLFDGVTIWFGETSDDFANGCCVAHCGISNCQVALGNRNVGIYFGWNWWQNTIYNCKLYGNDVCVQYDLATGGTTSGAIQVITGGSAMFNSGIGILFTSAGASGFSLYVESLNIEHLSVAGIKMTGAGEDLVFINGAHFELYDATAYFIDMDGGNVFLDGFWALSTTEKAWFKVSGGNLFVLKGRGSWNANKFAKITGGTIIVDPNAVFCGSRWWGDAVAPMASLDSSGGKIVSTRDRYVGQANKTLTTLTNASPGPVTGATISPFDGNERVFEFDVESTASVSVNNTLRITLTNGHSTVRCDLQFPLALGGAHVIVTHTPGGTFSATATYALAAGGDAQRFHVTTTDTSVLADARFLVFETVGAGTVATMQISNFYEYVSGPSMVGL